MDLDSQYQGSKAWVSKFQPSQIVCLELNATRLYAEVVQIVEARRLCWARPLVLVIGSSETANSSQSFEHRSKNSPCWHDLRQGADLLLPAILFRPALDVEAIPVLSSLYSLDEIADSTPQAITAHHQLREFIRQLCQFYPDAFSDKLGAGH
ncbi:hypothetical protein C7B65_02105 [Phormidesmis priestleyi ULC007]|uniref:Uncharacterized protein n=1 Tax=Phormidesmis priestleyi ULC007 TaxID=1920490 RepID=A0A2T1DP43_9CYAN|nr:hypothetical protein [Phormidesmis priestleyi]PSB22215.1 hypothetical protein C7B65_02105 [Phormidesmis priestleyi ULC007]PZO52524.1 MAG: hypothetical protein DCF14_06080 [Phormidesmis priestleyi]